MQNPSQCITVYKKISNPEIVYRFMFIYMHTLMHFYVFDKNLPNTTEGI